MLFLFFPVLSYFFAHAGRRIKSARRKSLSILRTLSQFEFWGTFSSNVKLKPVISWNGHNSFHRIFPSNSQDYYISNFLRILRILLHLKQLSHKTKQHKGSENLPFSNLVIADRKRRGQGGVMWTKDHKRSDANHIAWINLIESNTTHCAKLGLMRLQESYIGTFITLVPSLLKWLPQASLGAFPFTVWKNWYVHAKNRRNWHVNFIDSGLKVEIQDISPEPKCVIQIELSNFENFMHME